MLRYLLVLLIGVLLGANVAWYVAQSRTPPCPTAAARGLPSPVAAPSAPVATTPATPAPAAPPATPSTPAPAVPSPGASGLVIPVAGIAASQLVDTYTESRSEGRTHEAIDIMAPAGTPVLAAVEGPIAKLFTSVRGGLTIYQFDPEGRRVYYYAHLQGYAPGLAEGQSAKQGQVIGFVGSTGDASPTAPHLHFGVGELGPEKQWSKSTPVNPFPLLAR